MYTFSSTGFTQMCGCYFKESNWGDGLEKTFYFVNGCLHAIKPDLNSWQHRECSVCIAEIIPYFAFYRKSMLAACLEEKQIYETNSYVVWFYYDHNKYSVEYL